MSSQRHWRAQSAGHWGKTHARGLRPHAARTASWPWIRSPLFLLGSSSPGKRWGWPESCSQLEVINTAGNPSQAAISEILNGMEGKMSSDSVFHFLEQLLNREMSVGDSPPPSLSGAKEKHPRVPAIHSISTHPLPVSTAPSPATSKYPRSSFVLSAASHGLLRRRFSPPKA